MCDCFHLAFPNWHATSSGTAGRRLRAPEPGTEDDSVCDEPSQFTEGERPRPQGSSPVEEFPEKYTNGDKECEAEHDPRHKSGGGKKSKKSGLGSMFEKRSTPKMSKLKEAHSPESEVIVKTATDGSAEGLVYRGGGKEGIFIKGMVPESPASKSLKMKEGDQILSATVYFDNVPYEDAVQILEHAQAYRVELCLKRKPIITETEAAMESDVIPEEELGAPEMREQGKTKRRGDARISWPKFPSFGKGRKTRFTRSHSSSEADEQRKLELSPTTSDTESPIKTQDTLKGKKRHKMKLSLLTKRSRISSSEDTDAPTNGQTSSEVYQTASEMLDPECLDSLEGETPQVYVTEELRLDQKDLTEPKTAQHKVDLICIDSTLKTADLTVALADQGSSSGVKSPTEKKKKKEKSELKVKIMGKDKSHKKDVKAKASPKRLKTLGASIEIADQPVKEKSDSHTDLQRDQTPVDANSQMISSEASRAKLVTTQREMSVPKVELDISDVTFFGKSHQKGEELAKKDKEVKQYKEIKMCPSFKLPKIGLGDITNEETIQTTSVNAECPTKMEKHIVEGPALKDDPYDRLSKSSQSRTQLPKREDIEIPGMEDMSLRTKAKGIKEPKAVSTGRHEDIQAEDVQMSIDVDSVKEAVSKLPGFKLPKMDTFGMPIPEEITVIDANAQRISVKTPTKVADTKSKHEAHLVKFDLAAADLTSEELLIQTKVDYDKVFNIKTKQSDYEMQSEIHKREDIIIPGKESGRKEFGFKLPKQIIPGEEGGGILGERTILLQEVTTSQTETRKVKGQMGGVISDVKVPELDSIEYIDSVGGSPAERGRGISLRGFGVHLDATRPRADMSSADIRGEDKEVGPEMLDKNINIDGAEIKVVQRRDEIKYKIPNVGMSLPSVDVDIQEQRLAVKKPEVEIKPLQTEVELDGQGSKFKMPKLGIKLPQIKGPEFDLSSSKKDIEVKLPEAKAGVKLPEATEVNLTLQSIDVSIPEQIVEVRKPELEIKPLQSEVDLDAQGSKFKMPKFGIKLPQIKGPEFDLSSSKKDIEVKLPEAQAGVKLLEAPEVNLTLGTVDVSIPEQMVEVGKPASEIKPLQTEVQLDGQGSKFKMPQLGIKMPQIKGPEFDLSLSKKDGDVKLPKARAGVKLPEAPGVDVTLGTVDVSIPEHKVEIKKPEVEIKPLQTEVDLDVQGSKLKMPKFGIKMPQIKGPEFDLSLSKKDADVTLPEFKSQGKLPDAPEIDNNLGNVDVSISAQKMEIKNPELQVKPLKIDGQPDRQGSKFKMPELGITMPQVKGPEINFGLSKKDDDVTLPEAKVEVKVPEVKAETPEIKVTPKRTEGSALKFKMPSFNLPKFGIGAPNISVEPHDMDKDVKIDGADLKIPGEGSAVNISAPGINIKGPSIDLKTTGAEQVGQGSKLKMPHLPKVKGPEFDLSFSKKDAEKADVTLGSVDVSVPEQKMEVGTLEIKPLQTEVELDGHGSKFKMPKFGISMPKVKGPDIDLSWSKKDIDVPLPDAKAGVKLPEAPNVDVTLGSEDISIPEQKLAVEKPEVEIKPLQTEIDLDGHGRKFKMPKFGISMPKVKGPDIDLSFSKKDVDVKSPQATAEFKLPDAPEIDVKLGKAEVSIPDVKMEVEKPELEMKSLDTQVELDGHGSKFRMPKFGITMPKVKGPELDFSLSKKDVDVRLPEAKAEVSLPDVEVKETSAKVEVKAPEIKVAAKDTSGSPSRFKMPTFSFSKPKVKVPDIDLNVSKKDTDITSTVKLPEAPNVDVTLGKAEVLVPEVKVEVKKPEVQIKPLHADVEFEGQGGKFKMPKFGISMPKVKGPDVDLSFSKKDVDVKSPEATTEFKLPEAPEIDVKLGKAEVSIPDVKMEVEKPELEMKTLDTQVELDRHGSKFKMPKFGIKMPKVKGPELDFSLSKKDVDVRLPEAKADITSTVKLPEAPNVDVTLGKAEVLGPEVKVEVKKPEVQIKPLHADVEYEGQGGKFKMPKFGISMPKVKGPDVDLSFSKKDVNSPEATAEFKLPEAPEIDVKLGKAEVSIPDVKMEVEKPELEIKPLDTQVELDGHGSKFRMPKFGITMPKVKGPELDFSLSKKDVDVRLPEAKVEVSLPDVEVKEPSAKVDIKAPEIKVAAKDTSGSPSRFKMPTFGFSKPKVKVPDIDLNVSKKDTDITSTVKLPEAPKVDVSLGKAEVLIPEVKVEVKKPEVQIKPVQADVEYEGQGGKFKMPKFGISMPKVKGPDVDLSLSKKDVDVKSPEAKAEFKFPEAPEMDGKLGKAEVSIPEVKMEFEKPELEIKPLDTQVELDGHGSKFKMPKFGIKMPEVKGPEFDLSLSKKDVDVRLPEAKAEVSLPDVEVKEPSAKVEVKAPEIKVAAKDTSGSPSRFKMPTFSFSKPKVKGPDIDLNLSKKDTDITATVKLPEAPNVDVCLGKAEVLIPEVEVEVKKPEVQIKPVQADVEYEGQGGKFKMPKFGISMPKVKGPDIDLSFSKKDVDVKSPEATTEFKLPEAPEIDVKLGKAEVSIPDVKMEVEKPELEMKTLDTQVELDRHGSKFKMPKFGITMPKVKGPELDFSLSKKDADVRLPEAKAEVSLPEVEVKETSAKVEVKAPEIKVATKDTSGSPSRFKMPTFSFSKSKVKGPDIDLNVSKKDTDITATVKLPEAPKVDVSLGKAEVLIPEVKVEVKKPEVQIKPVQADVEYEGQGGKFKMPKFGISMPKVKGPDVDLSFSKKDVDVTLPEAKAEVKLPDVEHKDPSAGVEIKASETEGHMDGSPSKFKLPTFKFPKFGIASPTVIAEVPDMEKDKATVDIAAQKVDIDGQSLDVKMTGTEGEGKESKFKMPSFGISLPKVQGPKIDLSLSKKDVDVKSPEAEFKLPDAPEIDVKLGKAEVSIPDVKMEVEKPELEIKPLESQVELDGLGSKLKMPKFGITMPKVKGPELDFSISKKDVDVRLPEAKAEVSLPDVEVKEASAKVEVKAPEIKVAAKDTSGSPSRFKMPTFGFSKPKVKVPDIDLNVSKKDTDITSTVKLPEAPNVDVTLGKAEVLIPEVKVEVKKPEVQIKPVQADVEYEGQGGKFKMPKFGISMPKVKGPDVDLSFSKKDVNSPEATAEFKLPDAPEIDVKLGKAEVSIPDVKMEVEKPELEMKTLDTQVELDRHGSKFKMPKFGIKMPKVKGPELDFSLSKKDVDVRLPEAKAEVSLPDVEVKEPSAKVEVKAPEIEAQLGSMKESPSKFKLPSFKFPKFGGATPNVSAEVPDTEHKIKIDGAGISVPDADVDVEVKGKVSLPEVEVKEPSVDVVIEQQEVEVDAIMKKPKFSMPRFSFSKPSVKAPEVDLSVQNVNVELPEGKMEVKGKEVDMKSPEVEAEIERQGSKFKMPKFGISMPKVTGPEMDLSLSNKDVEVKIPEAKTEVQLPDVDLKEPSAEVEIKPPEIKVVTKDTDGSPSKFKMPTFKLPKFGIGAPSSSIEIPDMDKDVKLNGDHIELPKEVVAVDIAAPGIDTEGPSIDLKTTSTEQEGKGSMFKLPSLSFSVPQVKSPDVDLSSSKTGVDVTFPEATADVQLPDAEVKEPSAKVEIKAPGIEVHTSNVEGSPSKFKMPTFKLPKFGASTTPVGVEVPDVDIKVDGEDLKLPEAKAEVKLPDVEIKEPVQGSISIDMAEGEAKMKKTSWTLPTFSFSKSNIKSPEAEVNLVTPKVDVSLPEVKAEVQLPDVDKESSSISLEGTANTDLDAKLKKPKFSMPKFSFSKQSSKDHEVDVSLPEIDVSLPEGNVEVITSDVDLKPPEGDVKVDGQESKFKMPKFGISMPKVKGPDIDLSFSKKDADVTQPKAEVEIPEGPKIDVKPSECEAEIDGQGGKFKMPKFGISVPKVKGPEIDLSLSKKRSDVTLPEGKIEVTLPSAEVIEPEGAMSLPDAPSVEMEAKSKRPNWTFPKFSFSRTSGKAPEVDVNLESPDVASPELEAEVCLPHVEVKEPSGIISVEEPPAVELDGNVKKSKFSLPKFSFSKSSVTIPEVSAEPPRLDVSLPEGEVRVIQPEMEIKAPELNVTLTNVKADVKLPEVEVKESTSNVETDAGGSPLKFKMPIVKLPKFGGASYDVTVEAPDADKAEKDGAKLQEDVPVEIKAPSVDVKTDSETPKTETDSAGHGSPSRFKLPSFKMPKMSFSKPKPEEEHGDHDGQEVQPEIEKQTKSPNLTLTAIGEIFKNIDVEFDVSPVEKVVDSLEASMEAHETSEPSGKQLDAKEKETNAKEDTPKSPERTGWFKFPKFGLSSPSESAKTPERDEQKKGTTPETGDEEVSPTCSVQSSDAFADISSTMTSEHVGPSISSPTKVTVKYSDPSAALSLEEVHGNVITSTTRTQVISLEPHLPEKITILSSEVSSSSEDTFRPEPGFLDAITAKLGRRAQLRSPLQSQGEGAASWAVEDSLDKWSIFGDDIVRETSSERSESKETIVITKQITRVFESSEETSSDAAESIQRLRDSVHSDKMRFFDGAEK